MVVRGHAGVTRNREDRRDPSPFPTAFRGLMCVLKSLPTRTIRGGPSSEATGSWALGSHWAALWHLMWGCDQTGSIQVRVQRPKRLPMTWEAAGGDTALHLSCWWGGEGGALQNVTLVAVTGSAGGPLLSFRFPDEGTIGIGLSSLNLPT